MREMAAAKCSRRLKTQKYAGDLTDIDRFKKPANAQVSPKYMAASYLP
jgi:hypothetical protein